ncbi:putative sulfate/molybdate transporter [Palleronia sp.]|uniref:putative sulfate/molybdate transporter n=1 Tax=Palleronia sp. TaxID=1940284 RepID=UPI0035C817AE
MRGARFRFDLREASGALGDLGTLLPLMLGTIAVVGLAPMPVVLGFALSYIATAFWYRLPIPVQPMKAVAAVLLTAEVSPESLAASGMMIGAILLILGSTGLIDRIGRLVPQSVLAGLQLGLGITLSLVAFELVATAPVLGIALVLLIAVLLRTRLPAAAIAVAAALLAGRAFDLEPLPLAETTLATPTLVGLPSWEEMQQGVTVFVLPQLALTLTNAIILTALIAGDYFDEAARHVTPRRLSISSGLGNLLLAPFGALPMCHGAGGVAAHHRFGARSGGAPLILGVALLAVALVPDGAGLAVLAAIPAAGLGALLLVASCELAVSKRLFDCKPSCYPVIAATAGATVFFDPFWALVAGTAAEGGRTAAVRALRRSA